MSKQSSRAAAHYVFGVANKEIARYRNRIQELESSRRELLKVIFELHDSDCICVFCEEHKSAIEPPAPAEQDEHYLSGVNYVITRSWADKHLNSDDDLKHFNGKAEIR